MITTTDRDCGRRTQHAGPWIGPAVRAGARWRVVAGIAALVLAGSAAAAPRSGSESSEWRLLGGNADVWHHSPLQQINDRNVQQLGLAWMAEIPSQDGLTGNPLVADGVVYQSGPLGRIYANDVRSGKLLWQFAPEINYDDLSTSAMFALPRNRGLALLDDHVFVASGDCRLFAVNRRTGKQVWEVTSCDMTKGYGITQAPRVGDGKVFIGNGCGDTGVERGYVDAFDAKTGKPLWRFYTMPGDPTQPFESKALEMASKTWGTDYWSKTHGCVSPWDAMTYDEKLDLLYIGTGGPAPWNPLARAPDAGDELFSNSIVAVNASTGEYVWHYQVVQHDGWNFEAANPITIAELPVGGGTRRVVMTTPKNGFFYVLDAKTGQFLSANNFTPVTWASHIDPATGRPVTLPGARYWESPEKSVVVSPGPVGSRAWHAMAFNPATRLVYLPVLVIPTLIHPDPQAIVGGAQFDLLYGSSGDPNWKSGGELVAWDPVAQKARWRVSRTLPVNGGVLSTAGNLVFQGTAEGQFEAFAADTGKLLWSFNAQGSIQAAPTTVVIDGEQLILVPTGNGGSAVLGSYIARYASTPQSRSPSRLLAFKLGGRGTVPPTVVTAFPQPPLPRPAAELAQQGRRSFEAQGCDLCHGSAVESAGRHIPDLRRASAQTHIEFPGIVLGGLRRRNGMPAFPHIPFEDLQAIQAYVLDRAWAAYDEQQASRAQLPTR